MLVFRVVSAAGCLASLSHSMGGQGVGEVRLTQRTTSSLIATSPHPNPLPEGEGDLF